MNAKEIAAAIRTGGMSSVETARACLDRIERHNPKLNAFLGVCAERALEDAARADAAVRADRESPIWVPTISATRRESPLPRSSTASSGEKVRGAPPATTTFVRTPEGFSSPLHHRRKTILRALRSCSPTCLVAGQPPPRDGGSSIEPA